MFLIKNELYSTFSNHRNTEKHLTRDTLFPMSKKLFEKIQNLKLQLIRRHFLIANELHSF